ncbi:divalent cation transporter [Limibacter armeniacum]|uniref:ZIP family metal transporter n=1 Tax=Limibacter armeniacum TaxID=466084 RepID=UPI002FE58C37
MLTLILLYAGFAGITVFLGGILANYFEHHIEESPVKYEITHTLMAFGAGIILSAVALVLVPKGLENIDLVSVCISFLLGAVTFFYIDRYLALKGDKMATLLAMLMDFIPESIVLGAVFSMDPSTSKLLAIFIGLQNLPEAFNSFRDLVLSGFSVKKTLLIFFALSFLGIISALIGHYYLSDFPDVTAKLMMFASGGILYLIFQDIVPESELKGSWTPSLGATLGFLVGIIGEKIV